ncbi:hypothetical protein GIB67_037933 [Kingdonia uniflora]|uniref:DUF8039 domain-containing protein n=1 Tax=Kingdonia uniflora TaxID=39325 RepID=A0A7J7LH53_9MAGN|nr:hypothetical protein GIB67_037933 [Kingdonia uniflora]
MPNPSPKQNKKSKKMRGSTKCMTLGKDGTKTYVNFNERGQPVELCSEKLSPYLGTLGRDMVHVIYDDWRHVPLERKDLIWEAIKQRFTLDEESRSYCRSTVGRLSRSCKTRLRRIIDSYKSDAMIMKKRPKEIDLKEWKFFVKGKSSPVFKISKDMESSPVDRAHMRLASAKAVLCLSKDWDHKIHIDFFHLTLRTSEIIDSQVKKLFLGKEKNKKFKNMSSKQVFPYTGSRRGYARLENDMKKKSAKPSSVVRVDVWAKAHTKVNSEASNEEVAKNLVKIEEVKKSLPLNSTPPPLKDDMLSQVLEPKRQGRVRALGFGVTPTRLGIISQTTGRVAELEEQLAAMMGKMEKMSNLISKLIRNQAQSVSEVRSVADDEVLQTQTSTPQAQCKRKAKGTNCKLLSWKGSKVVVAHAQWVTEDPKCMLHNQIPGPNVCKVVVTNAINSSFPLWKATGDATTIGGALKSFIAWPKKYVVMKHE